MKYDIWERERNQAENLGLIKVLRQDPNIVLIWKPKATKPYAHYRFKTPEQREQYIKDQIANRQEHENLKEEYKQSRKGTPELLEQVKPGTIFHWSWGYDQTNCQFFQVIERNGYMVKIKEIGQKGVGSQGFDCENRVAVKDSFIDDKVLTKKIYFWHNKPYLSFEYGSCSLWNGKPMYCSWYA
jgi:hypothetical protein